MENQNNNKLVFCLLGVIIVLLVALCVLFATGTISFKNSEADNNSQNDMINNSQEETNTNSLSTVCTADEYDSKYLKELVMENKTEKIGAMGGGRKGYNVTTTVTKQHNYNSTPENNELYANDMMGTLYVLYKNKLYYTSQKDTISKYCSSNGEFSWQRTCDYSKFNDDAIKEFNTINIDLNLKAIGSYGNAGSGAPTPYAITIDGKVINLSNASTQNNDSCGILYDNTEYPIDRIFNMYFYDGVEYTILLKNGTLITRDVDREHPIDYEH